MFKSNLINIIRNFARNKVFTIINILGLAIGLACVLIILSWVRFELSFDTYHQYADRIYRVEKPPFSTLAPSFVPLLKQDFPEIEYIARVTDGDESTLKYNNRSFVEKRLFFAEQSIFNILSMDMVAGDKKTALSQPNDIVLTESMVRKYFGSESPMGKTIMLSDTIPFLVTGIIKDIPANSSFHFDFLASYLTLKNLYFEYFYGSHNFSDNVCLTYMRTVKGADIKSLEEKLPKFIDKYVGPYKDDAGKLHLASETNKIKLIRVADIHLHSHTVNEVETNGDISYVRIFSLVALFILFIACINFINLSIAKGLQRSKEIALKKTFGSRRQRIVLQLIADSFFYSVIALFLALVLYETALPFFTRLWSGWDGRNFFRDPGDLLLLAGILILTSLIAGLYPAFYLSRFQPIQILRNNIEVTSRYTNRIERGVIRKALVILQFCISIAVMIGIGVISRQIRYIQNADLGFDKENILLFSADDVVFNNWKYVKQRLLNYPGIVEVTASKRAPSDRLLDAPGFEIDINGNLVKNSVFMPHNRVEEDFFRTYKIKIVAGRDFDPDIKTDTREAAILNETAVRQLGFKNAEQAIGTKIRLDTDMTIIGVCQDFHYESLHYRIPPIVTYITTSELNTVAIRLAPGNINGKISAVQSVWNEFHNNVPFEYSFLDERINQQYKNEQRMLILFDWFGILAVFIASMGLFGLTAFSTRKRTKEIGIRKTNGATTGSIMIMLSYDFTKWVIVSFILACPISYYFMHKWLQNFAYKTNIGWGLYLTTGIITLFIAIFTVSWQSFRAANRNPVEALRYE